jgi:DNA-binding transcriptional ArsR family regulator
MRPSRVAAWRGRPPRESALTCKRLTLFELCARLVTKHDVGSSRQAVSQHIDVLVDAGLVVTRREGRYRFHTLDRQPLESLADRWLQPPKET